MQMSNEVTRKLAHIAELASVMSGGVSMPRVNWVREEDRYKLLILVPGVDSQNLSLEVINHHLMVFQNHRTFRLQVPHLIHRIRVPFDVEVHDIHANLKKGQLIVSLPFNEMAGGYQRRIEIDPDL
jgi:HSP20 family molecular chaperone IbpA